MIRRDWSTLKKLMFMKTAAGGGAAVEATATGNPLTFTTDLAKPLKSLIANFLPQQESGKPSPSNILPITGWTGVNVEHFDENLLTINRTSAQTNQGITYTPIKQDNKTVAVHVEGERTNNNPFFNLNYITKPGGGAGIAISPGTYKIFGGTAEVRLQVFYHDANGVERIAGYDDGMGATVTIPADCTASWCRLLTWVDTPVDIVIYPIIMSTDSVITLYPVTWSESGTIYGGYVDLVTGEVWATYEGIDSTWNQGTNTDVGASFTRKTFVFVHSVRGVDTGFYSSKCNCARLDWSTSGNTHYYIDESKAYLWLPNETDSDFPVQFVTRLKEPLLITTLSPTQINAIIGGNTVWSDGNGDCSVTYLKKG